MKEFVFTVGKYLVVWGANDHIIFIKHPQLFVCSQEQWKSKWFFGKFSTSMVLYISRLVKQVLSELLKAVN